MEGTVQGHGPRIKTNPEPDARGGGSSAFGMRPFLRMQAHGCPGTRFWRESTALSTPKQVRTSISHRGQDSRHLPLTLREPSPSVFPEQGRASCSQSNREGRREKGGRPPSRHCHFSCCLATRERRNESEKSSDYLCPISSGERAVCVEYLDLESGGQI